MKALPTSRLTKRSSPFLPVQDETMQVRKMNMFFCVIFLMGLIIGPMVGLAEEGAALTKPRVVSASQESDCSFPDVCMDAPYGSSGIPIPYPNTSGNSDSKSGSKMVKTGTGSQAKSWFTGQGSESGTKTVAGK